MIDIYTATKQDDEAMALCNKNLKVGSIILQVYLGDITSEDVDAIVNSSTDRLSLEGSYFTW